MDNQRVGLARVFNVVEGTTQSVESGALVEVSGTSPDSSVSTIGALGAADACGAFPLVLGQQTAGAPGGALNAGKVRVFRGATGSVTTAQAMATISGETEDEAFGAQAKLQDMNGDGCADILVASATSVQSTLYYGAVSVHLAPFQDTAATDASFYESGRGAFDLLKLTPAPEVDVDGDGSVDITVTGFGDDLQGFATIKDFSTGTSLAHYEGDAQDHSTFAWGDLNGDGVLDLAVGRPPTSQPGVEDVLLFTGPISGAVDPSHATWQIQGEHSFGTVFARDYDGDGVSDLIVDRFDSEGSPVYFFPGARQ